MTTLPHHQEPAEWRRSLGAIRRDVAELRGEVREMRRWLRWIFGSLVTVAASVVGAVVSANIK